MMAPDDERIKCERLRSLIASGYRPRTWTVTDGDLIQAARHFDGGHICRVLDHPRMFSQGDDRIIVFHSYYDVEDFDARVQKIAEGVAKQWRCKIAFNIGEHLNIYYPSNGRGFEFRRHHRVRAKGMHRRRRFAS